MVCFPVSLLRPNGPDGVDGLASASKPTECAIQPPRPPACILHFDSMKNDPENGHDSDVVAAKLRRWVRWCVWLLHVDNGCVQTTTRLPYRLSATSLRFLWTECRRLHASNAPKDVTSENCPLINVQVGHTISALHSVHPAVAAANKGHTYVVVA